MANMTVTTAAKFIPKLWSDEVLATYKANLVAANLVRNLNHVGKKGDTIHIPTPGRNNASAKVKDTAVTLVVDTAVHTDIVINKHFEWSTQIEDIAELQALNSMRRFYTDDAGYALARNIDSALVTDLDGAAALTGGNAVIASVTNWDASILIALENLNDNNVPLNDRSLVVTPSCMTALMGEERFTEQAFIGNGNAIKTGKIGMIYGVDVYMSTQVGTGNTEKAFLFQKDALVLATQQNIRTQTQYVQSQLADLFTADTVYGTKVVRPGSIQELSS